MVKISNELAELMRDSIISLMCQWDPYDNGSDYACAYCGSRSDSNLSVRIHHMSDCRGAKMLVELNKAIGDSDGDPAV